MDKDTLQIIIMVAGFAITIIIGLLRFPSRVEMNQRFDEIDKRFDDMNQRINDINQRLIDLSADVRNIYQILIQGKPEEVKER